MGQQNNLFNNGILQEEIEKARFAIVKNMITINIANDTTSGFIKLSVVEVEEFKNKVELTRLPF